MSHIIVKSDAVLTRTIPARGDKKAITFREQSAAIEAGEDFPQPFNIQLDDDQRPYPPGSYHLDYSSIEVNEWKGLKFGRRVRLIGPLLPADLKPANKS